MNFPFRASCLALLFLSTACSSGADDANVIRGKGLTTVDVSPAAESRIYEASVRNAFDLEPGLVLLLHPDRLPRRSTDSTGSKVPAGVLTDLKSRGIMQGSCVPTRVSPKDTPRCAFATAGYVIRGSDIFRIGGDTVEMYLSAEKYAAASGAKPEALRFEKVYQLVGSGTSWRVVREGRLHER